MLLMELVDTHIESRHLLRVFVLTHPVHEEQDDGKEPFPACGSLYFDFVFLSL